MISERLTTKKTWRRPHPHGAAMSSPRTRRLVSSRRGLRKSLEYKCHDLRAIDYQKDLDFINELIQPLADSRLLPGEALIHETMRQVETGPSPRTFDFGQRVEYLCVGPYCCRGWDSSTYDSKPWIPTVVRGRDSSTYNLNIQVRANPSNVRARFYFTTGDRVEYYSLRKGSWYPTVVQAHNADDTYRLDFQGKDSISPNDVRARSYFIKDDRVEYWSENQLKWFDGVVFGKSVDEMYDVYISSSNYVKHAADPKYMLSRSYFIKDEKVEYWSDTRIQWISCVVLEHSVADQTYSLHCPSMDSFILPSVIYPRNVRAPRT